MKKNAKFKKVNKLSIKRTAEDIFSKKHYLTHLEEIPLLLAILFIFIICH
ncbi:uncharacterized protein CHAB577_0832 [Chlamydia abortus]|nr:uncharacterized protein CHAB577_0832 [Chlamydia abortus]